MNITVKSALLAAAFLITATPAQAEEESWWRWMIAIDHQKEFQPVDNPVYKEECGSCHLAYAPGLLPARSWEALLTEAALGDHFGDDASLDADTLKTVRDYAISHAADTSFYKRARKIALATEAGPAPLRITEVRYIKRKHHDIPDNMIKGNKDVRSLSHCNKCHTQADKGIFDSDTVRIPNFPDWKD